MTMMSLCWGARVCTIVSIALRFLSAAIAAAVRRALLPYSPLSVGTTWQGTRGTDTSTT